MVIGIEARGFIFAPALAYALGAGFVPVRKPKKLPAERVARELRSWSTAPTAWRFTRTRSQAGQRVLIVDDLLATGGTAAAVAKLVEAGGRQGRGPGVRRRADFPQRARQARRPRRILHAAVRQMTGVRARARLLAFAKINLDLRVLCRRPDNYHELRTIFQTISLADRIDGRVHTVAEDRHPGRQQDRYPRQPHRARAPKRAWMPCERTGRVEFHLDKRIPMGAGLGGGSSDAAAVLLALPVVAGKVLDWPALIRIAGQLGSDVPFFLLGGTAAAVGRGTELYPLPDRPARARPGGRARDPRIHGRSLPPAERRVDIGINTK